jgi:hypothetical protein
LEGDREPTTIHPEDRREGFFGMIEGTIPIIENSNSIPEFRVLLRKGTVRNMKM